jgi:NAD-dependent deacetylase
MSRVAIGAGRYGGAMTPLTRARALLDAADRVTVLTGAGISTASGIPDFRGPDGVWTKNPGAERTATLRHYLSDPEVRRRAWQLRLSSGMWDAEPNDGHRALVELERRGVLHTLVTQNIDGLHHAAGSDPERVVEIHGNVRDVVCLSCGDRRPMAHALDRVRAGEDDPACHGCGGILKSATISFGQSLVEGDLVRAHGAALACDVFVAVGTSLTVSPICDLVPIAHQAGAAVLIVNAEATPFDHLAAAVVREPISDALSVLVGNTSPG